MIRIDIEALSYDICGCMLAVCYSGKHHSILGALTSRYPSCTWVYVTKSPHDIIMFTNSTWLHPHFLRMLHNMQIYEAPFYNLCALIRTSLANMDLIQIGSGWIFMYYFMIYLLSIASHIQYENKHIIHGQLHQCCIAWICYYPGICCSFN